MFKFILIAAAVGIAAAGVLDPNWVTYGRTDRNPLLTRDAGFDRIDFDPIKRMSFDELLKQRFLVKILDNVQQPFMDREVCPVSETFVIDETRYRKGCDGDMMFVVELCRNFGQLKKGDFFNMANPDLLRQMIGLQRIFARSQDWETFNQNVCFARNEFNEILFVNAFLLAVRQREDTRTLVIPGIHEILPEFYLDRDVVRAAQNVDFNMLSKTNERDTSLTNFFDKMGLGSRSKAFDSFGDRKGNDLFKTNLWMPWRQLRMQMAMSKTPFKKDLISFDVEDKIVIPVEGRFDVTRDMTLLTNDVGINGFIQFLVNDLCLRENEIEIKRTGRVNLYRDTGFSTLGRQKRMNYFDDMDRSGRRFEDFDMGENRYDSLRTNQRDAFNRAFYGTQRRDTMFDFPTTSIDNDRLLHVNYRRFLLGRNNMKNEDFQLRNDNGFRKQDDFEVRNDNRFRQQDFIRGDRYQDDRQTFNDNYDRKRFGIETGDRWDTGRGRDYFRFDPSYKFDDVRGDRYMLRGSQIYDGRHKMEKSERGTFGKDQNMRFNEERRRFFDSQEDFDDDRMTWNRKNNDFGYTNKDRSSRFDQIFDDMRTNSKYDDAYTTGINDDRLLHKSRRRFFDLDDDMRKRNFKTNEGNIYSSRWSDKRGNDYFDDERFNDFGRRSIEARDSRLMMDDVQEFDKIIPKSDVLLHNLKQILARIENEKFSLGLENYMRFDNGFNGIVSGKLRYDDDGQTFGISSEELREIRNTIEQILTKMNIRTEMADPLTFDQIIANNLLNSDGQLNILDAFRDIISNGQQDVRSAINMGFNLSNPLVQKFLKTLCDAIDLQRTKYLGTYSRRELLSEGITVNGVDVDQLKTFIDFYDVDVRNLLDNRNFLGRDEQKMVVARLPRLNHKEFTIKYDVDSDRSRQVMIRTFLGPKLFEQMGQEQFDEIRQKFMLIDSHVLNLQTGKNVIKRRSRDFEWTTGDTTPLTQIYRRVMTSLENRDNDMNSIRTMNVVGQDCRFPDRLIIPRGKMEGLQMQLFVIVTDLDNGVIVRDDLTCAMGVGTRIFDGRSFGFPLDRRVDNIRDFITLPNVQIADVIVRHEENTLKDY